MEDTYVSIQNLYQRRFEKEKAITEEEIQARMRWDLPVLSSNQMCSISLDLPLLHCHPTSICAQVCYAAQGRQYYRRSVLKALAIDRLISLDSEHVARKMIDEATGRNIRIAGSGEILPTHASLLEHVDRFGGKWWGFTRRIDTHQAIPALMFSIDASTPRPDMQYVLDTVAPHRRAYLRRPQDDPSPIEVAVTFPVHGSLTNYEPNVPYHETDCPAHRKQVEGCWRCGRCY